MNGVINFYKEPGSTSFDAVAAVRRLAGGAKCGHLGTLDPMAEGVLPLCLGYVTRFSDYLSAVDKEYLAQFKLGLTTDSFDTTGEVISENVDIKPSINDLRKVFDSFKGSKELSVPAFSAKKINGVRAYKLARAGAIRSAGVAVMDIHSCELLQYDYPFGLIRVSCGKGTYIRSVIAEAGDIIGCGAAMSGLARVSNGVFKSTDSFKIAELEKLAAENRLAEAVIPITELLDWGRAVIKDETVKSVLNGGSPIKSGYLSLPLEKDGDNFFIEDKSGKLLAVASREPNSAVPLKITMVLK